MSDNDSNKENLKEKIRQKESQLSRAEQESNAWNTGKYKNSSNAPMSKALVSSLRKELSELREELENL